MENNFVCCICHQLPNDVVESGCCNSLFCWDCVVGNGALQKCPSCNGTLNPELCSESLAVKKIIEGLSVKCNYAGCDENVTVLTRKAHEAECPKGPVLCPHSDLCGIFERATVPYHVFNCPHRPTRCHRCDVTLSLRLLQDHLDTVCQEVLVECPNICSSEILRKDLSEHIAHICPNSPTDCPFTQYGCAAKPMRNGVSEHVHDAMADHMILMANCVREQQVQISTLQDQLSATQEAVSHIPAAGFISQLDRELTHYVNKFKRTPAWNSPQLASFREWITPLRFVIFMMLIFLLKSTFLFIIFKVVKWMVLGFAVRAAYLKRRNIRKKMGWIIGFIVLFIIW